MGQLLEQTIKPPQSDRCPKCKKHYLVSEGHKCLRDDRPKDYPTEGEYRQSTLLVDAWDVNNAICLLGDHRDDLIFGIAKLLHDERDRIREAVEAKANLMGSYQGHNFYAIWKSDALAIINEER